ncbi:MAG: hypothetical protein M5R36_08405 [Deltaproteobacteria bacterium]|nr:hypothetical protein [Deltaproteobacteria bacterium]
MNFKSYGILLATLSALIVLMAGCATTAPNLASGGRIALNSAVSDELQIGSLAVYKSDGATVVTGQVRAKRTQSRPHPVGHLDFAVTSQDGAVVYEGSSNVHISRPRHGKPTLSSRFEVKLPVDVPDGSIVKVAFHNEAKDHNAIFNCGANTAGHEVSASEVK